MQSNIQAVILRSVREDVDSYALYTEQYGRIKARDMRFAKQWDHLVVGDIGFATLTKQGRHWLLTSFESAITREQSSEPQLFYWRAHFLEMYFYYVPLEQPSEELFSLLVFILQIARAPLILFKLCGIRFFVLLGYHVPDSLRWYTQALHKMRNASDDESANDVLRFEIKEEYILRSKEVDVWLVATVMQHDHFQYLKTHTFLPQLYSVTG